MKLYLDDYRPCPQGWTLARTPADFIRLVSSADHIEAISFDHDLADDHYAIDTVSDLKCWTGYDCAMWMIEHFPHLIPRGQVSVHSMNPAGAARIRAAFDSYFKHNG